MRNNNYRRTLTAFFLSFLGLAASANAEEANPREQFRAAVTACQQSPNRETTLKVIEIYKQLDPPPAVPEEARRPFVMGATVLKKSNDKAGATKAVEYFTQALMTAPWFAEAYYNRALAHEITGQFSEAMDDLKLYLGFTLSEAERRDAQDKVYSLEADAQLAAAKKTEEEKIAAAKAADTPQAREAALLQKVEGARFVDDSNKAPSPHFSYSDILEIKLGILYRSIQIHSMGTGNYRAIAFHDHDRPGLYSAENAAFRDGRFIFQSYSVTYVYRIRPDGQALLKRCSNYAEKDADDVLPRQ